MVQLRFYRRINPVIKSFENINKIKTCRLLLPKPGFPKVLRTEPQGSARELRVTANEEYKQEVFYPPRESLFTMAIQMYRATSIQ